LEYTTIKPEGIFGPSDFGRDRPKSWHSIEKHLFDEA
jgi:hypothetical protein